MKAAGGTLDILDHLDEQLDGWKDGEGNKSPIREQEKRKHQNLKLMELFDPVGT